jgi:hypothetical protein
MMMQMVGVFVEFERAMIREADIGGTSRRQGGGAYQRAAEETR